MTTTQTFYLDPVAYEAAFRKLRAEALAKVMAQAKTQRERDGYAEMDALLEPALAVLLAVVRLRNQGESATVIGTILGNHLAGLALNAASMSDDPGALLGRLSDAYERQVMAASGAYVAGATITEGNVAVSRCGRA